MPARLKTRHIAVVVGIAALLAFQNCAEAPQQDAQDQAYTSGLPLAYNAKIDTIGYMSCSNIQVPVEPRAYFSFRAGAYNNATGGLSITPEFLQSTQYYNPTERSAQFAGSDVNGNTSLTLSIRQLANLQAPWTSDTQAVGTDRDTFLPALNSPEVTGPLSSIQPGTFINYFPGASSRRLMEASLRFFKFENVANDTRNILDGGQAVLTVGYNDSADPNDGALRGPNGIDSKTAYGSGFFMHFSLPSGYSMGDRRVISPTLGIQEIDLATNIAKTSNWDCSAGYEFMIVRPEDVLAPGSSPVTGKVVCNTTVDQYTTTTQQAQLNAIRRVLRPEDWWVDLDHHCVVPKPTDAAHTGGDYCYGQLQGRYIQYGVNCTDTTTTLCPHFVSVCIAH